MKKMILLFLSTVVWVSLSAQVTVSGGCLGATTLNLVESGTEDGKPQYIDNANMALLRWQSANNAWVLTIGGNQILFVIGDTPLPPTPGWTGLNQCAAEPPIVNANALPVTWAYLEGETFEKNKVQLRWGTVEEEANAGFYVERSADGLDWQQLSFVPSSAARSEIREYSYIDAQPLQGENLYRLQQEDYDGSFSYSEVVQVTFRPEGELLVAPNPASDVITVRSPAEAGVMTILNQRGQVVRQINTSTSATSIFVGDLPASVYVLRFSNKNNQTSRKIVIH